MDDKKTEKLNELMRSLTAAQAALWDVADDDMPPARAMLALIVSRITTLAREITGIEHREL